MMVNPEINYFFYLMFKRNKLFVLRIMLNIMFEINVSLMLWTYQTMIILGLIWRINTANFLDIYLNVYVYFVGAEKVSKIQ